MPLNIMESLKTGFGEEIVGMLGKFVGEDSSKTKAALGSVFPALLGGLVGKGSTPQGASEILDMIAKGGYGEDTLMGFGNALVGEETRKRLLDSGTDHLKGVFGDKLPMVIDWISGSGGVGKTAASSLLALAAPAVLGILGKETKVAKLDAGGLVNLLSGQAGFLKGLVPAALGSALGLPDFAGLAEAASESARKASPVWEWVLPLFILAAVLAYMLKTCSMPSPEKASVEKAVTGIAGKTATEAGGMLERLGKFLSVKLPGGIGLSVPEFGVEKKLIAFIEDAGKPVDKTTWFTFDRLEFETGSAELKASSTEQLKNVAEILKAYPKVALKIGGYTDNIGDPAANLKLSEARARNTMNELVRLGIDAKRLEAEGYGDKHPVADNSTEEGRRKNRRIDLRVTAK